MPVIKAEDAVLFELPGIKFYGLAAPSRGSTENSVWRVEIDPGVEGAPHSVTREEVFIATQGAAVASIDGHRFDVKAGDALIVPAMASFALSNPHEAAFHAVVILPVGAEAVTADARFIPPWAK
ncbi:cupin domain-containing protein [Allosphingosinicella vermicomposti]|uniref:cupin domain-containing protein n=1 Tax=Allosphingosinicella vermicomposti TaxID=614671 RepID=UPI0018F8ACFF|nr:cupin domain-containing protein [Allosphingosinicella vermicomposti]